mmetsp:Transcript_35012/g.78335  ORF Transcript_35012/g.78335 Transcript_35012/m.78335 type:complete len:261 (-) Transcript_35012:1094-1876(-)
MMHLLGLWTVAMLPPTSTTVSSKSMGSRRRVATPSSRPLPFAVSLRSSRLEFGPMAELCNVADWCGLCTSVRLSFFMWALGPRHKSCCRWWWRTKKQWRCRVGRCSLLRTAIATSRLGRIFGRWFRRACFVGCMKPMDPLCQPPITVSGPRLVPNFWKFEGRIWSPAMLTTCLTIVFMLCVVLRGCTRLTLRTCATSKGRPYKTFMLATFCSPTTQFPPCFIPRSTPPHSSTSRRDVPKTTSSPASSSLGDHAQGTSAST